ncbi:hypothetical protein BpHYR1_046340 [Brachionus plicatilis]|uniref:Uncharacterized protein n=1 Tax=Brachionus plicatilis TaxID=10195 RepID=A0A3M7PIK1_BRAPC|nr:hypothetical protein BpHYR1_046340 [Brachionus plicatilis]
MLKLQENSDIWRIYCSDLANFKKKSSGFGLFLGLLNNSGLNIKKSNSFVFIWFSFMDITHVDSAIFCINASNFCSLSHIISHIN